MLQFLIHRLTERGEIDRLPRQRLPAEPGESQQIVDQAAHLPGAVADHPDVTLGFVGGNFRPGVQQHVCEAGDRPEWRAQIVRGRRAEGLQFVIRRFQLRRPLAHPALQALVLFLDLREHMIEGVGQHPQFVVAVLAGPDRVVTSD